MSNDKALQQVVGLILKDIRKDLGDEFGQNFERQGFFSEKWARHKSPLRPGGHILVNTGALRRSVKSRSDESSVTFYSDLPFADIHNEGGEIKVTAKMKRYFWYRYYQARGSFGYRKNGEKRNTQRNRQLTTEAEFWKCMALMKEGSAVKIPKRQFIGMSREVEQDVREIIEHVLQEYFDHLDITKK